VTARKCKVCGLGLPSTQDVRWCNACGGAWEKLVRAAVNGGPALYTSDAAEWGAKRRAAAKEGGK